MRFGPLALLLALAVAGAGCLNEFEEPEAPHHVRIVNLELAPARVLSQDVLLDVTAMLDNRGGGDSDALRLSAKAFSETTGFLIAQNETMLGVLPGETTRPVTMQLKVPREGGVRIDVDLFEADLGKARASVVARNLGTLEPEVLDTGLRVRDVDFIVRAVTGGEANGTGGRATIQSDLYITNEGDGPSENLRVQVKAREISTRLVSDVGWVETGAIDPGATVIRSLNLTIPDGYNYAFEILTWRGEVIVARSEGVVQLAPTYTRPTDQQVVTENPNVRDFLSPTNPASAPTPYGQEAHDGRMAGAGAPSPEVPGFAGPLAILAALGAAGILTLLRRRAR